MCKTDRHKCSSRVSIYEALFLFAAVCSCARELVCSCACMGIGHLSSVECCRMGSATDNASCFYFISRSGCVRSVDRWMDGWLNVPIESFNQIDKRQLWSPTHASMPRLSINLPIGFMHAAKSLTISFRFISLNWFNIWFRCDIAASQHLPSLRIYFSSETFFLFLSSPSSVNQRSIYITLKMPACRRFVNFFLLLL